MAASGFLEIAKRHEIRPVLGGDPAQGRQIVHSRVRVISKRHDACALGSESIVMDL